LVGPRDLQSTSSYLCSASALAFFLFSWWFEVFSLLQSAGKQ